MDESTREIVEAEVESYWNRLSSKLSEFGKTTLESHNHAEILSSLMNRALRGEEDLWIYVNDAIRFDDLALHVDAKETNRAKEEEIRDNESSYLVTASLLTRSLLEYDSCSFAALRSLSEILGDSRLAAQQIPYRPYYFTLEFNFANINNIERELIRAIEEEGLWVSGEFTDSYALSADTRFQLKDVRCIGQSADSPFVLEKRGRIKLKLDPSAHPIPLSESEIELINEGRGKIADKSSISKINNAIKLALEGYDAEKADIYSVGVANCVKIVFQERQSSDQRHADSKTLLYDVGRPRSYEDDINKQYYETEVRRIKPDVVVLSHWDDDHVMGYTFGSLDLFCCPWIAPDYQALYSLKKNGERVSDGAKRLALYLTCLKRLYPVNELGQIISQQQGQNTTMYLWQGMARFDDGMTMPNISGIGIYIDLGCTYKRRRRYKTHNGACVVLPGDVPYSSFPQWIKNHSNQTAFLLVPHHCSEMSTEGSFFSRSARRRRFAVVCTLMDHKDFKTVTKMPLEKSCYKPSGCSHSSHPIKTSAGHIRSLEKKGYLVFPTGQVDQKIEMDFRCGALRLHGKKPRKRNHSIFFLWATQSKQR